MVDTLEVTSHTVLLGVARFPTIALKLSLVSGETLCRLQMVFIDISEFDSFKDLMKEEMHCHLQIKHTQKTAESTSKNDAPLDGCVQHDNSFQGTSLGASQLLYSKGTTAPLAPNVSPALNLWLASSGSQSQTPYFGEICGNTSYDEIDFNELPTPECSQVKTVFDQSQEEISTKVVLEDCLNEKELRELVRAKLQDEKFIEFVKKLERIVTS